MNRKCTILLLLCLSVMGSIWAATVSESQARAIAAKFMAGRSMPSVTLKTAYKAPSLEQQVTNDQAAYYIFNAPKADGGYVIVAGDDRVPAILGYSDSGTFDADDVPLAMQEWLKGYTAQIDAIAAGATAQSRSSARPAIAPLLPVSWGQGMPYSVLLPHISGSNNAHAYVGCVAVAMAQIMAYWQYPSRPVTTIPGYTSSSGKTYAVTMPSLSPIDFDWEHMQPTYYTNDSTSVACQAVSNLMLYSTTSLNSNFGLTSTGSYTRYIPDRLIKYFGYKNSAHYMYRENFSTQAWEDTIYNELAAGRPVAYGGNKSSGGHAFVCDGYDGEGRFHINWGWAGKSNGYFLLNLLNPSEEGIGSAAGAYGYVKGQGIAVGIEPDRDGVGGTAAFSFEDLSISSSSTTRSAASSTFSVSVSGKFVNNTNVTSKFRQGWGLYKDGELQEVLFIRYTTSDIAPGEYISVSSRALSFGAGITSGTYRILPIYSIYPNEDYRPCIGSDVNYIEVTFGGTYSCTIKGYGTAGNKTDYSVNSCTTAGTLNHGKPVTVTLDLLNKGTSTGDLVYMFVDGSFNAMGLANIAAGESGDIVYRFTPETAGTKTLTFSLSESGSPVLYTHKVTINTMPTATLDVSYRILGITDEENRIINADKYSVIADVTNTGTTTYDEDFSVRLYRVNNSNTNVGTELQSQTQPLFLAPGETKSLQFDFDHDLVNGWRYFSYLYYYSDGATVSKGTRWYTLYLSGDSSIVPEPDSTHVVTVAAQPALGGTVSITGGVTGNKAAAGDTVTVTATPRVGWKCDGITVGGTVGGVVGAQGTYSFVMPDTTALVTAHFSRSTSSVFQLVDTRDSITEGAIYVLVSKTHGKVMKGWSDGDVTFQAMDVTEWLDDDMTQVKVGDEAGFFTMTQVCDTTISSNSNRTAAYLTNGIGYLRTSNYNVMVQNSAVAESRAWMYVGNADNCLIRFKDATSGSNANWIVRYDSEGDAFKVMNWNVTGAETSRVWLYKLVDTPAYLMGDVNADGKVDVADVSILISVVLGKTSTTDYINTVGDMDGSHTLDVADVSGIISLILGMA